MAFLEVVWTDEVTGRRGYLVLDCLVRGAASGGLRMREGCTIDEVRDLARAMTLKEAVAYSPGDAYVPFGGGKGGIDCAPHAPEARGVLARYVAAMKPLLSWYWSAGEDLGVRQSVLEEVAAEAGLGSTIEAALRVVPGRRAALDRVRAGFAVRIDGIGLPDLVGGYGVAEAALAAARHLGLGPGIRAMVQGFGSMGGATARFLARGGVPVVGIADVEGVVWHPDGLDVEALLRTRDEFGRMDRAALRAGDRRLPGAAWLSVDAEILVPAAQSYVLDAGDAGEVRARLVVEAANAPTTPAGEAALAARGVIVIPDFVANLGCNAWWWWTLFGDIPPTAEAAFGKIAATLRRLVAETLDRAARMNATPRAAALAMAEERAAMIKASLK